MIFALLVVVAAQAAPPPDPATAPTAPPPATTTAPPADDKPPVVELKPTAPQKPVTPAPAAPAPPAPDKRKPKPVEKQGFDVMPTAALQLGVGTAGCCVGFCAGLVPCILFGLVPVPVLGAVLGQGTCAIITGTVTGSSEAIVGDVFGSQRAPLVWSAVAAIAPLLVAVGTTGIIESILLAKGIQPPTNPNDQQALARYQQEAGPLGLVELLVDLGAAGAAIAAPAVVYALTAVDKKPGDTGQGFPGIFEPADPKPVEQKAKVVTVAMRY